MKKFSTIKIRESKESKKVVISSDFKPEILDKVVDKWQTLINTITEIVDVPSGLIMRLNEETIEVFLKSQTEGNPYKAGEKASLVHGLYCETVIGTQEKLLVPDATKSNIWKDNNPDVDINMISYLGYPINWPDGEVFGTVCLLDKKENNYNDKYQNLLFHIKQHIETDLQLLIVNDTLKEKNESLIVTNNTKTRLLSLISHDLKGKIGTVDGLLKILSNEFDTIDETDLKDIIDLSSRSVSSSAQLLENLLVWAKNDFLQLKPDKRDVNLIGCIESLIKDFEFEINQKEIIIEKDFCSTKVIISADENMLLVILRNILSNSIKYVNKKGLIKIRVYQFNNSYNIVVEDTGIGMTQASIDMLFSYNRSHETQGTFGEKSSGIGLMLVKDFLDKHDATINIESEIEVGTKVKITWP